MEIWGHRGASASAPENSLTAFQMAAEMGADGIELDIQLTKDREVVVIHDETVDRTSNGHGYVKDFTLSELKKLNCNPGGQALPVFMEIPTLDEVMALLQATGLMINVELKTGIIFYEGIEQAALQVIEKRGMLDRIIWSSFNHYSVKKVKQLQPDAKTALLCGGGIFITAEQCERIGVDALHPGVEQLRYPGLAENYRKHSIALRPWTVDQEADLRLAQDLGVDAVITNKVDWAKTIIK